MYFIVQQKHKLKAPHQQNAITQHFLIHIEYVDGGIGSFFSLNPPFIHSLRQSYMTSLMQTLAATEYGNHLFSVSIITGTTLQYPAATPAS